MSEALWKTWNDQLPQPFWWSYYWVQWKTLCRLSYVTTLPPWQHQSELHLDDGAHVQFTHRITHLTDQQGLERTFTFPLPDTFLSLLDTPRSLLSEHLRWQSPPPSGYRVSPTFHIVDTDHVNVFSVLRLLNGSPHEQVWMDLLPPQEHNVRLIQQAIYSSRHPAELTRAKSWLIQHSSPQGFRCADSPLARTWYLLYQIHLRHFQPPPDHRIHLPANPWRSHLQHTFSTHCQTYETHLQKHLPASALLDIASQFTLTPPSPYTDDNDDDPQPTQKYWARHGHLDPHSWEPTVFARITQECSPQDRAHIRDWLNAHQITWITAQHRQWPTGAIRWIVWNGTLVGWVAVDRVNALFLSAPKRTVRELGCISTSVAFFLRTDAGRCQRLLMGRGFGPDAETTAHHSWWMEPWEIDVHVCINGVDWCEPHPYSLTAWSSLHIPFLGHASHSPIARPMVAQLRGGESSLVAPEGITEDLELGRTLVVRRHGALLPGQCCVHPGLVDRMAYTRSETGWITLPTLPTRPVDVHAWPYIDITTGIPRKGTRLVEGMILVLNCDGETVCTPPQWVGWCVQGLEGGTIRVERQRSIQPGDWLTTRHGYGWRVHQCAIMEPGEADVWISAIDPLPPWCVVAEHLALQPNAKIATPWIRPTPWARSVSLVEMYLYLLWTPVEPTLPESPPPTTFPPPVVGARRRMHWLSAEQALRAQLATSWGYEVTVVSDELDEEDPCRFPAIPGVVHQWLRTLDDPTKFWQPQTAEGEEEVDGGGGKNKPATTTPLAPVVLPFDTSSNWVPYPPFPWQWTTLYIPDGQVEERRMEDTRDVVSKLSGVWEIRPEGFWNANSQTMVPWLDRETLEPLSKEQTRGAADHWLLVDPLLDEEAAPATKRPRLLMDNEPTTTPWTLMATTADRTVQQITNGVDTRLIPAQLTTVQPTLPPQPVTPAPTAPPPAMIMVNTGKVSLQVPDAQKIMQEKKTESRHARSSTAATPELNIVKR